MTISLFLSFPIIIDSLTLRLYLSKRETITGGFEDVKAGESFTFTLDDITLDINGGDYTASLSGDFYIAPLTDTIESPTGTKYNIFEMTESDITNVATEVMTNVMSSPLGILISDMMYSTY